MSKKWSKVFEEVWLMFSFGQKYRRCSEAPSFVATDLNYKTIKIVTLILDVVAFLTEWWTGAILVA